MDQKMNSSQRSWCGFKVFDVSCLFSWSL